MKNYFVLILVALSTATAFAETDVTPDPVAAALRKEFAAAQTPLTLNALKHKQYSCIAVNAVTSEHKESVLQMTVDSIYEPMLVRILIQENNDGKLDSGELNTYTLENGQLRGFLDGSILFTIRANATGQLIGEVAEQDDKFERSIADPSLAAMGYVLCNRLDDGAVND